MSSTSDAPASAAALYFLLEARTLSDTLKCAELLAALAHPIESEEAEDASEALTVGPGVHAARAVAFSTTLPASSARAA